ncbi:NAD-dependent epimerase/dehydratase family protein [uncultured Deinococcus sp.]|uniref:NAD-dependent epimerase/dehydratase family protein n=1 Tax=uncultured Deinococcus sp. TaxID=158789 RepID=UPI0025EE3251|nr:NAD-dependent epimerase/dehydratase family protein [uncultured Deinococcus sp.]
MSRVLVTGGNGYLGAWVIDGLLRGGTDVRAVIRTLDSAALLRDALRRRDTDDTGLELVVADVAGGAGLAQAFAGTQEVYHLASPMQHGGTPEQIVVPARDSALYVLRAARDAGARRVVFTSSFAAVGYSPKPVREYTEDDWMDPATPGLPLYRCPRPWPRGPRGTSWRARGGTWNSSSSTPRSSPARP